MITETIEKMAVELRDVFGVWGFLAVGALFGANLFIGESLRPIKNKFGR